MCSINPETPVAIHTVNKFVVFWVSLALLGSLTAADEAADKQYDFAQGAYIQQDFLTAIEEFDTFLKRFPKDERATTAQLRLARCYLLLDRFEEAAKSYEAGLKVAPDHPDAAQAHFDLGRSYSGLQKPDAALPHYAQAAERGEGEFREEAMVGQGECLIALERHEEAAALYQRFLASYPTSSHRADILFTVGWVLHQSGRHQKSVTLLEQLLAEYPDYPQTGKARLLLSDANSAAGQYEQAAAALQELVSDETQGAAATLRLGWTVYRQGQKAEAARIFADFAKRYPDHEQAPSALYNAAVAHYEARQFVEAAALCERLQKSYPEAEASQESRLWHGLSLFEAKVFDEALGVLEPLLADKVLTGEHAASAHYAAATASSALQQKDRAAGHYRTLLKDYAQSAYAANAAYSLARLRGEAGQREEAVTLLRDLLAAEPPPHLADLARFALGEHLFFLEDYELAREQLEACTLTGEDAPKVKLRLGWTLFRLGRYEAAGKTFDELAAIESPFTAEAIYMAGRAAEELERHDQARRYYRQLAGQGDGPFAEKAHYALVFLLEQDEAREAIERYLQRFPNGERTTDLQLKLAELELAQGDLDAAEQRYRELGKRELTSSQQRIVFYGLGWCQLKRHHLDEAKVLFAKVSNPPADTMAHDARQQLGEIAFQQERYDDALAHFSTLTDLETQRAERALYMVGWSHRHLDQAAAAENAFQQQLERFPRGELAADAWLRLAESLHTRGEDQTAAEVIAKAREQIEPTEDLLQLEGEVLAAVKDWRQLIEQSKALLEAFPESSRAYLAEFRLGLAYRAVGMLDEAEAHFQATIAATNTIEAAKAQFNIGTLYMSRKKPLEAGKQFLRVELLYDYPDLSPKALYHATAAFLEAEGPDSRRAAIYREKLTKEYAGSEWAANVTELPGGKAP